MIGKKIVSASCCKEVSQRQHFNFLRNNSSSVYNVLSWQNDDQHVEEIYQKVNVNQAKKNNQEQEQGSHQYREDNGRITFNKNNRERSSKIHNPEQRHQQILKNKKDLKQRVQSADKQIKKTYRREEDEEDRERKKQEQQTKKQENKKKVKDYLDSMIPFSRDLSNSKFQEYYGKAALETYGRANTTQPIGGIIYGNHLKTFNVNPHSYKNAPENYQTYNTAINFGKRTKLNYEQRFTKLQKTLTKKLGLNARNETLKQGKQIVYVDVDDSNMHSAMKEDNLFKKIHRQQIRNVENQYKQKKQEQSRQARQQFYAQKKAKIQSNLSKTNNLSTLGSTFFQGEDADRMNQQVIYRHHDQNGNIRLAADRHGVTCFVDCNFPQNDGAYTEQLKSRLPIFPTPTKEQDRNIDTMRVQNYEKSLHNIYPSHYLMPNSEQPEVLKMFQKKVGNRRNKTKYEKQQRPVSSKQPRTQLKEKILDQTRQTRQNQNYSNRKREDEASNSMTKVEIMKQAWGNNEMSNKILEQRNKNKVCCQSIHLPHNEKNPQCYKNCSNQINNVPLAGSRH